MRVALTLLAIVIFSAMFSSGISKAEPFCGDLVRGSYSWDQDGSWCTDQSHCPGDPGRPNMIDGDWNTFGYFGGYDTNPGHFFINYAKPANAISDSLWQFKDGIENKNYSLPVDCWNADANVLQLMTLTKLQASGDWIAGECWNGTDWEILWNHTSDSNISNIPIAPKQYEQTMWWDTGQACTSATTTTTTETTTTSETTTSETSTTTILTETSTTTTTETNTTSETSGAIVAQQNPASSGGGGGVWLPSTCKKENSVCDQFQQCCEGLTCVEGVCEAIVQTTANGASTETTTNIPTSSITTTSPLSTSTTTQTQTGPPTGSFVLASPSNISTVLLVILILAIGTKYFYNKKLLENPTLARDF
jgi:hypothetical protein